MKKSSSKVYQVKELQGLNHFFQHCNECAVEEYGQLEESFALKRFRKLEIGLTKM